MDRRFLQHGTLLLILLLAFAVRLGGLTAQSLWRDEVDALRFSQEPLPTLIGNFTRPGWNGPMFYVLVRLWVAVAGSSELSLRYLSLGSGVLAAALMYRLGREWFTTPTALLAALLMACAPYMVWYGQEAKMYALLCVLAIVVLLLFYRAAVCGRVWAWLAMLAVMGAAVTVHIMAGLLLPVVIALFLLWWPLTRHQWRQAAIIMAALTLPALVALPWVFPMLARGGNIGHNFTGLGAMAETMLHAFSRGILSRYRELPIGLALFALLCGTVLQSRQARQSCSLSAYPGRRVAALWAWMLLPVLGLYAISLRVPMFLDRYLIWIGPAFYLLAAWGIEQVWSRSRWVAGAVLAVMIVWNGWGIWEQTVTPIKADMRAAAAYVKAQRRPDELVLLHLSYLGYTFEYYYGDASPTADGIPTDGQTTPQTVDLLMRERTAGYDTVWLILSEAEMWDPRGMTVDWLDKNARVIDRADLTKVSVVKYHLAPSSP